MYDEHQVFISLYHTWVYMDVILYMGYINISSMYPVGSMYGIFTYIWLKSMVNVGKHTIDGSYGYICILYAYIIIIIC